MKGRFLTNIKGFFKCGGCVYEGIYTGYTVKLPHGFVFKTEKGIRCHPGIPVIVEFIDENGNPSSIGRVYEKKIKENKNE